MHFACRKVYRSKVFLQELCCYGLISLRFLKFLFSSGQVSCNSCIPISMVNLTTHLFIYRCGCRDLITWGCFVLGLVLQSFPDTPPPWKPPSCTKTTKGSQLLQLLGLVLYGLGNWLYPVGPYSKLHNFLYFFPSFFKQQCYLKLLSLEYQLPECCSELIWTANVLFWKCAQLLLLFSDGEVMACDPGLQRYVDWLARRYRFVTSVFFLRTQYLAFIHGLRFVFHICECSCVTE